MKFSVAILPCVKELEGLEHEFQSANSTDKKHILSAIHAILRKNNETVNATVKK